MIASIAIVACSSSERTRSGPTGGGSVARATVELLRSYPQIAPRVVGLPLVRVGDGYRVTADEPPARGGGPGFVDVRELRTGFFARLPSRAGGPMRLGVSDDLWIEVAADGDAPVVAAPVEGALVFSEARPDVDVVMSASRGHVEELRLLRSAKATTTLRYRVRLGPAARDVRVRMGAVEVLDRDGVARLRSEPWFAVDASHRRIDLQPRLVGEGSARVLEAEVAAAGASFPIAVDPAWGPPTSMAFARADHTASVIASGRVLVVGGESFGSSVLSAAEIFDPVTRTWTIAKATATSRTLHSATVLASGKVAVFGGATGALTGYPTATSTVEVYDPATDVWSAGAPLSVQRYSHVSALLSPSGAVLVAAGIDAVSHGHLLDAEVWDATKSTTTAVTNAASSYHARGAAFGFGTNRVLLVGSDNENDSTGDVYDGATNQFAAAPALSAGRSFAAYVGLADGRVLVAGGRILSASTIVSSAEMFSPTGGAFGAANAMPGPKLGAAGAALTTSRILIAGGVAADSSTTPETATYLYDVASGKWSSAGALAAERLRAAMAPLPGGAALITGGTVGSTVASTAEIWGDGIAKGGTCYAPGACASGFCVDGVCCATACTGQCESCNEPGNAGSCTLVKGAPRGGRVACTGTGTCAGTCDGALTGCSYPSTSTVCTAATCVGGTSTGAAFCDGKGACDPTPLPIDCAPYACGATGCKTSCATAADCVSGMFCEAGACAKRKKQGDPCSSPDACATGFCEGGVCCTTACSDACSSCNVPGSVGVCTSVPGCSDAGADASTDGAPPTDAVAEAPAPNWGATPTVAAGFQRCTKGSECASGNCVEGVCCDSPCTDRCHSCALLTSPGKCTPEPIGVDLKNECGAALSCVGTCGPDSQCIGAGQGTMCARNRCTGATSGVGPAYCPGPGGKCATDDAVPFECGPYLCEPAFGACSTSCTSSDDCARGYLCDLPSKTCVALPPPEDDGGCAMSADKRPGGAVALPVLALVLLAAARRRRAA
ncbi:MAG: hypothetical protein HYV09_29890 [Deltaproteobacteria bacterium]|nr:hypothetical protein [Deltaproteobacteria bacterium]